MPSIFYPCGSNRTALNDSGKEHITESQCLVLRLDARGPLAIHEWDQLAKASCTSRNYHEEILLVWAACHTLSDLGDSCR